MSFSLGDKENTDCTASPSSEVPSSDKDEKVYIDALRHGLDTLDKGNFLHDIEIVTDGRHFKCHKVILCLFSDFFKSMFSSGMKECEEKKIELKSVKANAFESIITFIYSGEVTVDNLEEVLTTSLYLQIKSLSEICQRKLIDQLDENRALDLWRYSKTNELDCNVLLRGCEAWMLSHLLQFSKSEDFDNISAEELEYLLSNDSLFVPNEDEVCHLAVKWFQSDIKNREQHLYQVFQHVRFPLVRKSYLSYTRKSFPYMDDDTLYPFLQEATDYLDNPARHCDRNILKTEPRKLSSVEKGIIVISGSESIYSKSRCKEVWFYSFRSKIWFRLADLPYIFEFGFATCTYGESYVYVCGGHEDTCCFRYNGQGRLNKWKRCANMVEERAGHSLIAVNKSIYAIGGMQNDYSEFFARRTLKSIEKYNRRSKPWKICGKLQTEVVDAAVAAVGNIIYIFGGSHEPLPVQSFDVNKRTSCVIRNLPTFDTVYSLGSDEEIYLFDSSDDNLQSFSCEKLKIVDVLPNTKLEKCEVVKYGSKIYLLGGYTTVTAPSDKIFEYDIETGEFKSAEQTLPRGFDEFGCHVVTVKKEFLILSS